MQLYALDHNHSLIFAGAADRKKDYVCRECGSLVRVRGGLHRKDHFYHVQSDRLCRQNGKGMEHIQLQTFFYQTLSGCELEKRFPEINRIADVVWLSEKLIFEIQCSPISAEEVKGRIQDYASLGFQVIWILHEKQFNARRLSAAEKYLTPFTHYYTDMRVDGQGRIYDQFDVLHRGQRMYKSISFPVIFTPIRGMQVAKQRLPERLSLRVNHSQIYFSGDLHEHLENAAIFEKALEVEAKYKPAKLSWWRRWMLLPCRIIFRLLLERACR